MEVAIDDKHPEDARKQLAAWIASQIQAKGWSTREAGRQLNLPHPRIHQITKGEDTTGISLEKLLATAVKLGATVSLSVEGGEPAAED